MPRAKRGGARQGAPGTAYGNRSDLTTAAQPVRVPTGGTYGLATASASAQHAMPLPQADRVPTPPPAAAGASASSPAPVPGSLTALDAPTTRPQEPITHGLPVGPGAGPEALGQPDTVLSSLRAAYQKTGSIDLLRIILDEEARRG